MHSYSSSTSLLLFDNQLVYHTCDSAHQARISCALFSCYEERNRSWNAERAKQPLLPLTSAILNHNCPSLLVRYIHRPPFRSPCFSIRPFLHPSSFPLRSSLRLALSPSSFFLLEFLFSPSLSLVAPDASPLPVGSKRSSAAAAAAVAIVARVGAKLPQFCTFYTAREKKEDNFWWKRNNFIGRCYVRSVGVYCRCALHLSASRALIRNSGPSMLPNVTSIQGGMVPRPLSAPRRASIAAILNRP